MLDSALFNERTQLSDYRSDVWRVVESQEDAATLSVVDDLGEQELLEHMLDDAKPAYRKGTENMHYLLKTAFRYPPLRWGSRFGTTTMPSYFYASEQASTALCECAYYRFLFLDDMLQPYKQPIRSQYCLFKVLVASDACLDLADNTYASVRQKVRSPSSYAYSQSIGRWAFDREGVGVIRFESARKQDGINLAVAEPSVIRSKKPTTQQRWLCLTKPDSVSFSSRDSEVSYVFTLKEFSDSNGKLLRVA